jgi:hypothetical protein
MRIELTFERNAAYMSGFSSGRNIHFVQNSPIHENGRNTISLGKKNIYVRCRRVYHIVSL